MSIVVKITTYLWENDDKRFLELKIKLFPFFSKLIYGLLMTRKKSNECDSVNSKQTLSAIAFTSIS